ncbi:hypothetical protein BTO20_11275 [Mycobacterium dioxanotrophicus]|uniref:Uncharacterized protein n=1 Tax=Mycobacterium dioxanotrophicus TaxID=482462 RepID=A0A1Y0C1U5_9MYCO|nr:hypothetical protein [Mycobacterium dioxanotrophicus]ART69087.1 hypothetical protein BTO20_11275 [Mycobacterium dioxanotrophicus]
MIDIDSRFTQVFGLLSQAVSIIGEPGGLYDETVDDSLAAALAAISVAREHVDTAKRRLAQCPARTMSGGQCEHMTGHNGPHCRALPHGRYEWTDEQVTAAIADWEKRARR